MRASDAPCLHLTFGDHVHELSAAQQYPGTTELLEARHRPRASLDCPMILLDNIVQILLLANLDGLVPRPDSEPSSSVQSFVVLGSHDSRRDAYCDKPFLGHHVRDNLKVAPTRWISLV